MVNFTKMAVAAAAAAGVSAQSSNTSICDKYTVALLKDNTAANQYTLLTLLVKTAALGSFTGPGTNLSSLPGSMVKVPGILAPGNVNGEAVNLKPYFTGELASTNVNGKPAGVNWLDTDAQMLTNNASYVGPLSSNGGRLLTHLIQYFGAALGCSHYGQMGFPNYAGDKSQANVHKYMALDAAQVTYFIQQVGASAQSFGVSKDDITTVANLLNKVFNYRCSPPTTVIPEQGAQLQSICQAQSCPLDPKATCDAYNGDFTASSQIQKATATVPFPQSATGAAAGASGSGISPVSVIGDGQPQAPTTAATALPRFTGAAAANAVPAGVAGVAGLFAFLL